MAFLRKLVPGAYAQAIVAAIDAVADRFAVFTRDRALVLDGEIRNALARIKAIRRGKCVGGTDIETGLTRSAVIDIGAVARQVERGEDGAEKQPRAVFARHEIGVLALQPRPAACASGFSITAAVSTNTFTSPPAWAISQRASVLRRFLMRS